MLFFNDSPTSGNVSLDPQGTVDLRLRRHGEGSPSHESKPSASSIT